MLIGINAKNPFRCVYSDEPVSPASSKAGKSTGIKAKLKKTIKDSRKFARHPGAWSTFVAIARALLLKWRWRQHMRRVAVAEDRLFSQEVKTLRTATKREPILINPKDINTKGFIAEIAEVDPYFFLTLAGPLYGEELLNSIRGIAINQHAGHSPAYKGTSTVEWALYQRNLHYVSSTVHQTTPGADEGPILRRSSPTLFPDDDPATIFCRVVALGTELMLEVVQEIMASKHVRIYPQPVGEGQTYLGAHMSPHVLQAIYRDHASGWLRDEYLRLKRF